MVPDANLTATVLADVLLSRVLPAMERPGGVTPLWLSHPELERRRLRRRAAWSTPPSIRTHDWFEVCFVLSGEALALIEDGCYLLKVGDLVVVPSNREHDFGNTSADYDALWLEVNESETRVHLQYYRRGSYDPERPVATLMGASECYATSHVIRRELRSRQLLYERVVEDELRRLFIQAMRHLQHQGEDETLRTPDYPESLRTAIEIIANSYHKELSVPDLCAKVYLSPNQLNRLFRQHTGKSVWQYVTEVRLNHARELLMTTDLSVRAVAISVGYRSVHHFVRTFKRAFGNTPMAARRQGFRLA